jgi:transcriptional regulator with XRE-family HTH domain
MTVGKFIRKKRLDRKMSQVDLCKVAHITQSWLSQIEGDVVTPDPSMIRKILSKVGVYDFVLIYHKDNPLTTIRTLKLKNNGKSTKPTGHHKNRGIRKVG